jgi:hypothetical protein
MCVQSSCSYLSHSYLEKVRRKLVLIDNNADKIAEVEMKRFLDDEKRTKRMAAREMEIKTEASTTRRTLLQARQFLDEFS